jgi:very-short-patch-repair endonuclease
MDFIQNYGKEIADSYSNGDSIGVIAKSLNTYPNKIRRVLIKLGVELRSKSDAQKLALSSGRHSHPTRGKKRNEETKDKISESVHKYWVEMSDEDYQKRVEKSRAQWDNMTEEERDTLRKAAGEGVRRAAKEGSKMERFLYENLIKEGYDVQFHRKGLILNEELELDLFVPSLEVAIEIDGPAHFFPIWGEENLQKHIKADSHKNGLLLSSGYIVIRVKHLAKNMSNKKQKDALKDIIVQLEKVRKKKPSKNNRFIELEIN